MTTPVRLWLAAAHHPAFLNGGWAYVRAGADPAGPGLAGEAGGERRTDRGAMVMVGLELALTAAAQGPVTVHAGEADAAVLAGLAGDPALRKALGGRELRLMRTADVAGTPLAFARAWADLAADRAKAKGGFRAAIPKPNLAKVTGV